MRSHGKVRPCSVAGMFYPAEPGVLRGNVRALLAKTVPAEQDGRALGLVVPHAGYQYSGWTAAHAYARLQGEEYTTVIIVSPSHREYFDGISVYPGDAYATPLGQVPVDSTMREALVSYSPFISETEYGHGEEHAIEVQIPFLQEVLHRFMIVPVVVGDQRRKYCLALGQALAGTCRDKNVLLVASTDLSHYHSGDVANRLDAVVINDMRMFDYEKLMSDLESGLAEACGGGPAVAVMDALHLLGASSMEILHHCNSGDVTGDRSHVVGYLSAAAYA